MKREWERMCVYVLERVSVESECGEIPSPIASSSGAGSDGEVRRRSEGLHKGDRVEKVLAADEET